jgi:hypothetical protein
MVDHTRQSCLHSPQSISLMLADGRVLIKASAATVLSVNGGLEAF